MFNFLKKHPQNKELDKIIQSIEVNASNNYKDAAQKSLKQLEEVFERMAGSGELNDRQRAYYEEKLKEYKQEMKNFTHKDQKPTWV